MNDPKDGEVYLVTPSNVISDMFNGDAQQKIKFCTKCGEWNAVAIIEGLLKNKIMRCKCYRDKSNA